MNTFQVSPGRIPVNPQEGEKEMKYAEYREKVKTCRSSGMGEHPWCEAQGIKYETYHSWRERVRRREGLEAIDREIMRRSPSKRKSYDEIRELVVRCRSSGKTSEDWCREHGIVHSTYCNWRKKVIAREGKETLNQECGIDRTRCDSRFKAQKEPDLIEIHLWG